MFSKPWRRVTESTRNNSLSLGIEELNKGEYSSALCCFDEAIKCDPSCGEAYYYRGKAYGLVGKYDRAIEDLDKAVLFRF